MSEKIVAITLMRKGSKRFPNKCMADLGGKPLYQWTVDFAEELGYPYYLAHDYDDLKLENWVHEIKRKPEYTGSNHRTCEEIKSYNIDADIYILLQATNPIRNIEIEYGIKNFVADKKLKCCLAARQMKDGYYYTSYGTANFNQHERDDNGCLKDLIIKETGSFYMFRKSQLNKKHILDTTDKSFICDENDIDIDTEADLEELKCKLGLS